MSRYQATQDTNQDCSKPLHLGRLYTLDAIRGFTIISMVVFHICYDLQFLQGKSLLFFQAPFIDIWRASISWVFLVIAGVSCSLSRNNLYRALRYGLLAFAIWLATTLAAVDAAINFGIIFCMAASTLIAWLIEQTILAKHWHYIQLVACIMLFLLCLSLPAGFVGIGQIKLMMLPRCLYQSEWLSWLGFPGPHFVSGDYYPLLPYGLLYVAGAHLGWQWKKSEYPEWLSRYRCKPLEWIGRHPLQIYILHQPIILLLCYAL
ncbi:heparan-alpha-glucosaminide N-acetyltransferase [Atopobium sp. oral taxon 810]|uniref:heparan-alpha-glucosaminide N-acetyltransferase n=1 Tax=Atopobium sp. oral taxon 810 TaxID=712158 RepID=UPI00039609EE|nr:heparan-alpha-glucosaminide N-acetyltransferase [Atopobium sp. oral taxon 810]ERI03876.1 hypothetical protein HMPREF9069_01938 [Atopobium sp. oral taxon 810 str. F0209]